MSNKTLLSEAQIRQFMKLAKLEPLTPGFVLGLGESHGRGRNEGPAGYGSPGAHARLEEEEDLDTDLEAELGAEDEFADEEGDELDAMEEPEVEAPAVDAGEKMISVSDLLTALEDALEAVTGEEVSAEMDPDMEVDDEVEADVEMDAVDDMEADTEMEMDGEEELMEGGWSSSKSDTKRWAGATSKPNTPEEQAEVDKDKAAAKKTPSVTSVDPKGGQSKPGETKIGGITAEAKEVTDELVEQITKRVAARILKSALAKKK